MIIVEGLGRPVQPGPEHGSERSVYGERMQLVDLHAAAEPYWEELIAGEQEPFGAVGAQLRWRDKTHNIGIREDDGRLVAAGGVVLADVQVAEGPVFQVAGLGGVIVTRSARGRGLANVLVQRLVDVCGELGVERAMLFCRAQLVPLYAKFGFLAIEAPVRAEQPTGPIEMPMPAMLRALSAEASWPAGAVRLLGEPF